MSSVYLSMAYLAPVQYYSKLYCYNSAFIEAYENYQKQTYRNRCVIATANGTQVLTVPIEKPSGEKCLSKDIRISDHGNWRHLHWNALVSAYNMSPFFEFYQDEFALFYEKNHTYLLDFNESLCEFICDLLDISINVKLTSSYKEKVNNDYRQVIRPKHPEIDQSFNLITYYQVFQEKYGFLPNLSIVDLLFNMGNESLLILRDSIKAD